LNILLLQVEVAVGQTMEAAAAQVVIGPVWLELQTVVVEAQHRFYPCLLECRIPSLSALVVVLVRLVIIPYLTLLPLLEAVAVRLLVQVVRQDL
jgi:hypothetical protein